MASSIPQIWFIRSSFSLSIKTRLNYAVYTSPDILMRIGSLKKRVVKIFRLKKYIFHDSVNSVACLDLLPLWGNITISLVLVNFITKEMNIVSKVLRNIDQTEKKNTEIRTGNEIEKNITFKPLLTVFICFL